MVSLFKCISLSVVLALVCAFMFVASEDIDIQTTTTEDLIDPDAIKTLLNGASQMELKDVCSLHADCAFRIYNRHGQIIAATVYCKRCSDGSACTLVEDNTRKRFLRYKCLPADAESSTEDTDDVAETSQVQQGSKSWSRTIDPRGDIMASKQRRSPARINLNSSRPIFKGSKHPQQFSMHWDEFNRINVEGAQCSPNDFCAFRIYFRDYGITTAMTMCESCSDGFDCIFTVENEQLGFVFYKCLPADAEKSEDTTEGIGEKIQVQKGVKPWPRVFNLTRQAIIAKRRRHRHQAQSFETKREQLFEDVHEL